MELYNVIYNTRIVSQKTLLSTLFCMILNSNLCLQIHFQLTYLALRAKHRVKMCYEFPTIGKVLFYTEF